MLRPIMVREMIEEQIVQAEGHVTLGLQAIARREEGVAVLKHCGNIEAADSVELQLIFMRKNQVKREARRDRLREELKKYSDHLTAS